MEVTETAPDISGESRGVWLPLRPDTAWITVFAQWPAQPPGDPGAGATGSSAPDDAAAWLVHIEQAR